jgi:SAM-dependent methyltransferase
MTCIGIVEHPQKKWDRRRASRLISATFGTFVPPDMRDDWYTEKNEVGESILHGVTRINRNQRDDREKRNYHYPYIPFEPVMFLERVRWALTLLGDQEPHFIDVGCGIGDKLLLTHKLLGVQKVSGIEYNEQTFAVAQENLSDIATVLVRGDAFQHNFAPYNLIYLYCPISSPIIMQHLFRHIARTAPNGAVIMEMLPSAYIREYRNIFQDGDYTTDPDWVTSPEFGQLLAGYGSSGVYLKTDGVINMVEVPTAFH